MTWESLSVVLACGCNGTGSWANTYPGDDQKCSTHGPTIVSRVSRVTESRGSRDASLGLKEAEHGKEPVQVHGE